MLSGSMYSELIDAALADPETTAATDSASSAAAEAVRCRRRLDQAGWQEADQQGVDAVLADEVAYDVALVRYARAVGFECDTRAFGWPHTGRRQIEELLASRGIALA
jgi:hypothetical protein